jgi:hypothetical protein
MNEEELRKKFLQLMNAPDEPPLEATRRFLQDFVSDEDSLDSIRGRVRRMAAINTRMLWKGLQGIESLLANRPASGILSTLVSMDANWVLDDPSDAGAKVFLSEIAEMLHEELSPQC